MNTIEDRCVLVGKIKRLLEEIYNIETGEIDFTILEEKINKEIISYSLYFLEYLIGLNLVTKDEYDIMFNLYKDSDDGMSKDANTVIYYELTNQKYQEYINFKNKEDEQTTKTS